MEEEESPNPHPQPRDNLKCPPNTAPLRGPRGGLWKSPAYPLPGKFSGVTPAPLRLHLPRVPGARREKGLPAGGAPSRDPRAAVRRQTPGASPRSADRRLGEGGGSDGRPGLRGPDGSGQVQRPSRVRAHRLGSARHDPPWDTRPAPSVAPTPPGTRASGPPTPASAPGVAQRALLTPHYPQHRRRAPRRPRAPCLPPRPPRPHREPGPHLCQPPPLARSLRLCRRRSEPHTHRYTQPSDVTEPSARPRHCGDTRLPADAAAVSGRPGESEGGGKGEGWGTEPAAAPRARPRRRRCRRRRLSAPSPSGTRAPSGLLWLLRAPPSPRRLARAPPPKRAPGAPGLARRLGGWRAALSAVHPAQTGCSLPAPPPTAALPPSFLESPSRLSGAATAPPPPHPLLCGDGPDPGAPWPLGCRATGREGAGRPRGALCATPAAGRARPAERRRPRSGTGDPPPAPARPQLGRPALEAAGWRPPCSAPGVGPALPGAPGLPPPPPRGLPPAGRPASCLRSAPPRRPPPCSGGLRPDAFPG